MKYKHIPAPTLAEGEEKQPIFRIESGVFINGWEIGKYVGEDADRQWVKLREAMTLSPEQEEEWQRQQAEMPPSITERVDSLEHNVSDIVSGVTE